VSDVRVLLRYMYLLIESGRPTEAVEDAVPILRPCVLNWVDIKVGSNPAFLSIEVQSSGWLAGMGAERGLVCY
jgi:hypothetical protein